MFKEGKPLCVCLPFTLTFRKNINTIHLWKALAPKVDSIGSFFRSKIFFCCLLFSHFALQLLDIYLAPCRIYWISILTFSNLHKWNHTAETSETYFYFQLNIASPVHYTYRVVFISTVL